MLGCGGSLTRLLAELGEKQLEAADQPVQWQNRARFSAELNVEEGAEGVGVSPTTLKLEWRLAKAWLGRELRKAESE
jgi:hypothetical protein